MIGGTSASLIQVAGQISNSHHKATSARAGARSQAETFSSPSAHRTLAITHIFRRVRNRAGYL
ncbi:MAG: hypothetical protein CBCREVIR_3070 [Candidatus Burkholderia crenata]|nr:MAG: hypothetical protein CBCREVIR_3070 [Candidatus Burkholderia crenata]